MSVAGLDLWAIGMAPDPAPPGWRLVERAADGAAYRSADRLFAIVSGAVEADGKRWIHLSLSRKDRIPSWEELGRAKQALLGDRYAVMVLPPRSRYVNIHPFCLNLFACVDGHPLPEFSGRLPGGRRTL